MICYQVAARPLNMCALLEAEMITINKQRLNLDISHHESIHPPSSLLLQLTSSQCDKSSSPYEKMKDPSAPPLLDAPLLHENTPSQEKNAKTPWKYSPCKLQANTSSSSISQGLYSNPHEVRPPPQDLRPSPLLQKSQVKNESQKYLYPLFSLLMPTLKDQWPRLYLAKSNLTKETHFP
jgi:hypothetical protein